MCRQQACDFAEGAEVKDSLTHKAHDGPIAVQITMHSKCRRTQRGRTAAWCTHTDVPLLVDLEPLSQDLLQPRLAARGAVESVGSSRGSAKESGKLPHGSPRAAAWRDRGCAIKQMQMMSQADNQLQRASQPHRLCSNPLMVYKARGTHTSLMGMTVEVAAALVKLVSYAAASFFTRATVTSLSVLAMGMRRLDCWATATRRSAQSPA